MPRAIRSRISPSRAVSSGNIAADLGSDGPDDLGAAGALEQVSPRTGPHCRETRLVVIVHRQNEHGDVSAGGHDPARRFDAVEPRHLDVHQHDIGLERRRAGHGLLP
jgi:hypothetical protein